MRKSKGGRYLRALLLLLNTFEMALRPAKGAQVRKRTEPLNLAVAFLHARERIVERMRRERPLRVPPRTDVGQPPAKAT